MKIAGFNGSSRGARGNTNVMLNAFLAGARSAGADTEAVILIKHRINRCLACVKCWTRTPGKCVQRDDMAPLLDKYMAADIVVLATPVYVHNVSGTMKVFMDRMIPLTDPRFVEATEGETIHRKRYDKYPDLVAMASGGFPDLSHFAVLDLLFSKIAESSHAKLVAKIFRPGGNLLTVKSDLLEPIQRSYLALVQRAGREVVEQGRLSAELYDELNKPLVPKNLYIAQANRVWEELMVREQQAAERKRERGA